MAGKFCQPFTKAMEDQIINDLNDTRIKRRGFPSPAAIRCIRKTCRIFWKLVKRIRAECPDKDIWV